MAPLNYKHYIFSNTNLSFGKMSYNMYIIAFSVQSFTPKSHDIS